MTTTNEAIGHTQYLTFYLGGEEYAISILEVKELIEYEVVTAVPGVPAWIRGVINVRGRVVPIVDLAVKFGLPEGGVTNRTCIVIVEVALDGEPTTMGIVADSVSQVVELLPEDIEEAPPFGSQVRVDYLVGMGKVGQKFALILDIGRVLSANELLAVASIDNGSELDSAEAAEEVPAEA